MNGPNHVVVGLAAVLITVPAVLSSPESGMLCLAAGVAGALLPDLDSGESSIRRASGTNRSAGCLGRVISAIMPGHRGIIHSPWLAAAIAAGAWYSGAPWAWALAAGWVSHIIADGGMAILGIKNGGILEYALAYGALFVAIVIRIGGDWK